MSAISVHGQVAHRRVRFITSLPTGRKSTSTIICEKRAASSRPMVIKATQNSTNLMRVGPAASAKLPAGHIGGVTFMTSGPRTNPGLRARLSIGSERCMISSGILQADPPIYGSPRVKSTASRRSRNCTHGRKSSYFAFREKANWRRLCTMA